MPLHCTQLFLFRFAVWHQIRLKAPLERKFVIIILWVSPGAWGDKLLCYSRFHCFWCGVSLSVFISLLEQNKRVAMQMTQAQKRAENSNKRAWASG